MVIPFQPVISNAMPLKRFVSCNLCKRKLEPLEPIYVRYYRGRCYVCGPCTKGLDESFLPTKFRETLCQHCGRPIFTALYYRIGPIVCGYDCRIGLDIVKRRQRRKDRAALRRNSRLCLICRKCFESKRSDSFYCSNACKQKAYRRRALSSGMEW